MTNRVPTEPQLPTDALPIDGMGGDEARGRSAGVVVGAVMGLAWIGPTLGVLPPVVAVPVLIGGIVIVAALMTGAHRLRRAAAAMPASARSEAALKKMRNRFTLTVLGEGVAIVTAGNILSRAGRSQWMPAVVCAVVGLHFVPLARLFRSRLYYFTAAALCLVAATTMVLGVAGAPTSLWKLLPGFGAALVLWATGASALVAPMATALRPRPPAF